MRPLVLTVCSVLLAATLLPGVATASPRGPGVGDMAPALLGQDPDGKPVTLDAWHGKLVVVAFWNTKCAYCLVEVPTLEKLQQAVGTDQLRVVAVSVNDTSKDWSSMLRQMRGYSLVQARDPSGTVAAAWGVQMFPNLWLLDTQGRVQRHYEGYLEDALPGILEDVQRAALEAFPQAPAPASAATPEPAR